MPFVDMASYSESPHSGANTEQDVVEARGNIVAALGRMERGERHSLDEMREVLCAFVSALKANGASPEQIAGAVREVVSSPTSPEGASQLLPPAREALVELAVYWCGEELKHKPTASGR